MQMIEAETALWISLAKRQTKSNSDTVIHRLNCPVRLLKL